jgi:hypothetical protein
MSALSHAAALGEMVPEYVRLRALHPLVPARRVVEYIKRSDGTHFEQFICRIRYQRGNGSLLLLLLRRGW